MSCTQSTATTGAIALSNLASGGSSGGTLDVSGSLSASTLAIGGATYTGALKVSGTAGFSGAITSGATTGSKIVGGGASTGTLTLSSGTVGSAVAIGGGGANENNLALVKATIGTLTVSSANNTYTGGTTLVDGGGSSSFGIALGANNALSAGPLVIGTAVTGANGARLRMAGFNQTVSTLSSGATANARVIENFGAANSTLTVNGAASSTYAGFLRDRSTSSTTATGNLGLVKDGAGTLTLTNASNQYTGATVINGGVLEVAQLTNGGIAKTVTSTAGSATVTMADTTGITPGMTFVAANLPTGNNVTTVDSFTNITINTTSGIVSGSSTANFGIASSIGLSTNAASNLVFGGGTLRYNGASASTDRNSTVNSGQSAKWDVANAATTLSLTGGAAASTGGLEKLGSGTLVMAGANAYTGGTTITAGTLLINNTNSTSAVTVASGSTLGGSGTISGSATIIGSIAPGAAATIGTLNIGSNTTWNGALAGSSNTDWKFQLGAADSADLLNITGNFLSDTTVGSAFRFDFQNSAQEGIFKIVDWSGTTTFNASDFSFTNLASGYSGSFAINGSQLEFTAVPEPGTVGLLVCTLLGGVILRRRANSRRGN